MTNRRIALALIETICSPDNDADLNASLDFRNLLIDIDDDNAESEYHSILRDCINALDIQTLSLMRLDESLCPMHCCDYAICFDDDDDDCALIRELFPNHDT